MPLVLSAGNNTNYGTPLINQKYAPLAGINLAGGVNAEYSALFTNRINLLTGINAYPPNTLNFYGTLPVMPPAPPAPMVVISSNRANWLREALQNAVNHGAFGGYLDNTTFNQFPPHVPVPWFSPMRSMRPVYIVVHWSEYAYYERLVGNNQFADVTVVGYKFTTAGAVDIVGFGASRYAALQLMIHRGYHRAWAVDDNVINVNGFPNTLAPVEALMPLAGPYWALGFGAATDNINAGEIGAEVNFQNNNPVIGPTAAGLLQQVVLWNLDLLRPANLNYSPLFVTSNEDVSLSNYLQFTHRDERIFTVCSIIKFEPYNDPGQGQDDPNIGASVTIPIRRNRLLTMFSGIEADTPINPGGGPRTLQTFIRATVLPGAAVPVQFLTVLKAQSQAIEQVMSAGTTRGWYPGAPILPFNPYNGAAVIQVLAAAAVPVHLPRTAAVASRMAR